MIFAHPQADKKGKKTSDSGKKEELNASDTDASSSILHGIIRPPSTLLIFSSSDIKGFVAILHVVVSCIVCLFSVFVHLTMEVKARLSYE